MLDILNSSEVVITKIYNDAWVKKNIALSILRLDKIHPDASGNKLFKLYYFLQQAIALKQKVITFGGAYSNHLAATAAACRHYELKSTGIVRGEKPATLSPTLLFCMEQGMDLFFISRQEYKQRNEDNFQKYLQSKYGDHLLIPEGGFGEKGVQGASKIYEYLKDKSYTHICCSVGTATTIAGLIKVADSSQNILGFSALKELDFKEDLKNLIGESSLKDYHLFKNYHFGGYAKKTTELINFMNSFYETHSIPLDFVYTGKMMYGVQDLIEKNYFTKNSRIICIHTGGLQGNASLQPGILKY